jgi:hypothetical protein
MTQRPGVGLVSDCILTAVCSPLLVIPIKADNTVCHHIAYHRCMTGISTTGRMITLCGRENRRYVILSVELYPHHTSNIAIVGMLPAP